MTTFNPELLLRPDLSDFPPYSMGHLPLAELDRVIKLDLNENSFGPSPKAIAALAQMQHYHRYVGQEELRAEIAQYVNDTSSRGTVDADANQASPRDAVSGVDTSHIVVSNGADEMIDLIERIFLDRGDAILDCPPSFEMYSFFARLNGARIIQVPRRDDFSLDVEAVEETIANYPLLFANPGNPRSETLAPHASAGVSNLKLLFITSPSNPDGGIATHEQIERLLKLPAMLVLDEAYAEFAGESYSSLVPTQPNLIVLRTFSKWAGLASLRVGYCVAPQFVVDKMLQCKAPENVNSAGIIAARASLQDKEYLLANVRRIVEERVRLAVALARLRFLQPLPSRANFLLCRIVGRDPSTSSGRQIQIALAARGILIRAFDSTRLRDYIRIAVGTPEQNVVLLEALEEIGRG